MPRNQEFHALKLTVSHRETTVSSGETTDDEERRKRRGIMKQSLHIIGICKRTVKFANRTIALFLFALFIA